MSRWLVVGGGMRGIVAAQWIAAAGNDCTLIDANKHLGGILCPFEWKGFQVDKGCHLLDFDHPASGGLYRQMLGDRMHPVVCKYASINRGIKSDGIAIPDLSAMDAQMRKSALAELIEAASVGGTSAGELLSDALNHRFGAVAGAYMSECAEKLVRIPAQGLAASALDTLPLLRRIRLGPDNEMAELKGRDPALDDRLAVSSVARPRHQNDNAKEFTYRNYYPSDGGMLGFCVAAQTFLEGSGVEVRTRARLHSVTLRSNDLAIALEGGEESVFDRMYWAMPYAPLAKLMGLAEAPANTRDVGIALYTFIAPASSVSDYTYIHDFSPDTWCFRASAPGMYGRQFSTDGKTYVQAEVAVSGLADEEVPAPDRIWPELRAMGLVADDAPMTDARRDVVRRAFALAAPGWQNSSMQLSGEIGDVGGRIVLGGSGAFGKAAIVDSVTKELSALL